MTDKQKKFLELTTEAGRIAKDICQTDQALADIRHALRMAQGVCMGQAMLATRVGVVLMLDGLIDGK